MIDLFRRHAAAATLVLTFVACAVGALLGMSMLELMGLLAFGAMMAAINSIGSKNRG
ncbi:hypothetical protein [Sphingomonas astaxanthinifaciens]|uniref:Lipoprotein n=1 Tax=Sphingomonas astaxanthinifaciens DSM 22298 TaxID=1123267 RepID=A0ABQ5Z7V0_9SPHN|nr:hypothetical protein [Sphingomonas astaxanthinifaciens]GLR46657.1 hypothetical protein GCM10007925_03680 [Sphingomonas astaxanthinifaciens DSM 22298]